MSILKKEEYTISYSKFEHLLHEISFKKRKFCATNFLRENQIKILMPEYLKDLIMMYNTNMGVNSDSHYFEGVEILPHYVNEVVIYKTQFYPKKENILPEIVNLSIYE